MKGIIIYSNRSGTTKKYAEEIGNYLLSYDIIANPVPVENFRNDLLANVDFILLGCWTSGLFLFNQHPDKKWIRFAKNLPILVNKKIGFFVTYKYSAGSIFKKMKQCIYTNRTNKTLELKSKDGFLTSSDKLKLLEFCGLTNINILSEYANQILHN